MKDKNGNKNEICRTGNCGCSANYIWLGVAVILFTIVAAMLFGN